MREYRFEMTPAGKKRQLAIRVLIWSAIGLLALIAALVLLGNSYFGHSLGRALRVDLCIFTMLGAIVGASVQAVREAKCFSERQMIFVLNDKEIIRRRNGYPEVRIAFSEVDYLSEELGWLVIKSADRFRTIAVPLKLSGYIAIRDELASHFPLSPQSRFGLVGILISLLTTICWLLILSVHEQRQITVTGVAGFSMLAIGSIYLIGRTRGRRRPTLFWSGLAAIWCTGMILFYLRLALL